MEKEIKNLNLKELNEKVAKLDFIDFDKLCDYLAGYIDFWGKLHEAMPYAFNEFTPEYEKVREILNNILHSGESTRNVFKCFVLDYLNDLLFETSKGYMDDMHKEAFLKYLGNKK